MCFFLLVFTEDNIARKMNLSIQAVVSLQLVSCAKIMSKENTRILLAASTVLKNTINAKEHCHRDIDVEINEKNKTDSCMCTWRPEFCLDIFLYFPSDGNVIIALPMYGDTKSGDHVDIEYYHTETLISTELKNCVFFGHLTCDRHENGTCTMVILLYDIMLDNENDLDIKERYSVLLGMQNIISDICIGQTCLRVQWAGVPEAHNNINEVVLPHGIKNIVLFSQQYSYLKFDLV